MTASVTTTWLKGAALVALAGTLPLPTIAASPLPGGDDEARVEGMSPEESERQLEPRPDPTPQARVESREQSPFGHYLTNREGMTLYMFEQDQQGGVYSTCYESCAIAWPPYTTEASPVAGENIHEGKLATFERDDGTHQVTYAGWPLYYFARDVYPGDALGQGLVHMGGPWYLLSPDGEIIEEGEPQQAPPVEP